MSVLICKATAMVLILVTCCQTGVGVRFTNITRMRWSGTNAFFAVPREMVESKLLEMSERNCSSKGKLTDYFFLDYFAKKISPDCHVSQLSFKFLCSYFAD